jgi:hypothetical protein
MGQSQENFEYSEVPRIKRLGKMKQRREEGHRKE